MVRENRSKRTDMVSENVDGNVTRRFLNLALCWLSKSIIIIIFFHSVHKPYEFSCFIINELIAILLNFIRSNFLIVLWLNVFYKILKFQITSSMWISVPQTPAYDTLIKTSLALGLGIEHFSKVSFLLETLKLKNSIFQSTFKRVSNFFFFSMKKNLNASEGYDCSSRLQWSRNDWNPTRSLHILKSFLASCTQSWIHHSLVAHTKFA